MELEPAVFGLNSAVPPGMWGTGAEPRRFLAGGVAQLVGGKRTECTDSTRLPVTVMPVDRENKGNRKAINGLSHE